MLGIHNVGVAVQNNSGFAGSFQSKKERNTLTNGFYRFMMGIKQGRNFEFVQTPSGDHANGADPEPKYHSPPPVFDKPQWTRRGASR